LELSSIVLLTLVGSVLSTSKIGKTSLLFSSKSLSILLSLISHLSLSGLDILDGLESSGSLGSVVLGSLVEKIIRY
jgi:hypothetical protein